MRAALTANALRGAFPPVDLRAVCLVRAYVMNLSALERLRHTAYGQHHNTQHPPFDLFLLRRRGAGRNLTSPSPSPRLSLFGLWVRKGVSLPRFLLFGPFKAIFCHW